MNAHEAAKIATNAAKPSKELLDSIFGKVKEKASRGIRYVSLDLKPFKLSTEQLTTLKSYLHDNGYSLRIESTYQGTFCTLYW